MQAASAIAQQAVASRAPVDGAPSIADEAPVSRRKEARQPAATPPAADGSLEAVPAAPTSGKPKRSQALQNGKRAGDRSPALLLDFVRVVDLWHISFLDLHQAAVQYWLRMHARACALRRAVQCLCRA